MERVRCPQCGQFADENVFTAYSVEDDGSPGGVYIESVYCECGYEWPHGIDPDEYEDEYVDCDHVWTDDEGDGITSCIKCGEGAGTFPWEI